MKIPASLLILLSTLQYAFAQDAFIPRDTVAKPNNLFIKLHSRNAYGIIRPDVEHYNFKSMYGTGAEVMMGFKLYEKFSLGFGLQKTKFFLNAAKVKQTLEEKFISSGSIAHVNSAGNSSLNHNSFFIYMSGWKQNKRSVFEFYTKVNLSSFQYKLNSDVTWVLAKYNDTILINYDGGITNTGLVLGAGINYSAQVSKVFYISGGFEYNHNIMPETRLNRIENTPNNQNESYRHEVLPTPLHILQVNLGLMYRPQKPCNCKNMGLNDIR